MGPSAATVGRSDGACRRLRESPFFTILGLVMLALANGGFWPQYFAAVTGRAAAPTTQFWLIQVHAGLVTAWLLLYISQAALIMSGHARVHMKIGPWLAAYGFAIAAVGVYAAALLAHRLGVRDNDFDAAASFVFFSLIDMIYFAGFLTAAVALLSLVVARFQRFTFSVVSTRKVGEVTVNHRSGAHLFQTVPTPTAFR